MAGNVISEEMFSTQSYCDRFLGFCPVTDGSRDELRNILDSRGYEIVWDYPLTEAREALENGTRIVLVDTTYIGSVEEGDPSNELIPEYRWFEVPEEYDDGKK